MDRRNFIYNSSLLLSTLGIDHANISNLSGSGKYVWRELLAYARWCPSPHNVQPWLLKIESASKAELYYNPQRIPIVLDGSTSYTTVGMGMFVECLSIAAHPLGYSLVATYSQEDHMQIIGARPRFFAKLELVPTTKKMELDRDLILSRKTSRMKYDGKLIDQKLVAALREISTSYGQAFNYSSDSDLIDHCIDLNSRSILHRSREEAARTEMLEWLRETDGEAHQKKDGWWYKCAGFSGKMLYNFFAFPERFDSSKKEKRTLKMLNKKMKGTRNLAWISGKYENKLDWISAGRALQRMWLEMTKYDVYMSPLGPIINTPESNQKFKDRIGYSKDQGTLWFLIRLGHGKEPPRSLRLDINELLIT